MYFRISTNSLLPHSSCSTFSSCSFFPLEYTRVDFSLGTALVDPDPLQYVRLRQIGPAFQCQFQFHEFQALPSQWVSCWEEDHHTTLLQCVSADLYHHHNYCFDSWLELNLFCYSSLKKIIFQSLKYKFVSAKYYLQVQACYYNNPRQTNQNSIKFW